MHKISQLAYVCHEIRKVESRWFRLMIIFSLFGNKATSGISREVLFT